MASSTAVDRSPHGLRCRGRQRRLLGVVALLFGVVAPARISVLTPPDAMRPPEVYPAGSYDQEPMSTRVQYEAFTAAATASQRRCDGRQLHIRLGRVEGAAGNRYAVLLLTNAARKTCRLRGHPHLSLLDVGGHQIGKPAAWAAGNPDRLVSLRPGAKASTVMHWASPAAGPCARASSYLRVYAPGDTHALVVPARIQLCGGIFDVRNLVAGTSSMAKAGMQATPGNGV